jgi:hypothetical protein
MPKYLPKPSFCLGLGLSVSNLLTATVARSQSQESLPNESTAADANRQIQKANPLNSGNSSQPANTSQPPVPAGSTAVNAGIYTFVLSTPATIAIVVIIGGIAVFPILSLLFNSKKVANLRQNKFFADFGKKFQKPDILESDKFLHHRTFDKLAEITNEAQNINADKFGNTEFMTFFKIKSYIDRSIDEYANLDETIEMLKVAIATQNSFARIDSTESRYCSSTQQQLYKFVNSLLTQGLETSVFQAQVSQKLAEVLPLLKTEEGKAALEAYATEINKISEHALGLKLILLFKKYQLDDYSTLRSISDTINLLDSEDLLNLDGLMLLVMVKYDVFEKLGPIVGIEEQFNRPETYSKMLQYIGLKSRHETSYQKFQEFLLLLKKWEVQYNSIVNVRQKYNAKEYHLPPEFSQEVPGLAIYQKYKDSFHLISTAPPTPATPPPVQAVAAPSVVSVPVETMAPSASVVSTPVATMEGSIASIPAETLVAESSVVSPLEETPVPELVVSPLEETPVPALVVSPLEETLVPASVVLTVEEPLAPEPNVLTGTR